MLKEAVIVLLVILAGYGAIEARPLVMGPTLSLASPADGTVVEGGILTVSGHATRAVALMLDGAPVLPTENGSFSQTLSLPRGGSYLTLTATDRFGRTVSRTRNVFVP